MTDNEIIKALECCCEDGDGCTGCPRLNAEFGATITSCSAGLATNALSLINRQKAEIKRLTRMYLTLCESLDKAENQISTAQAEAIKEFAERLKEKNIMSEHQREDFLLVFYKAFDDLVKEMVGDDNG